jgi:hypothetical protein
MKSSSPTTVGDENSQPPVSYFQRSSGPAGVERVASLLSELWAQLRVAIATKTQVEMKRRFFFIATSQEIQGAGSASMILELRSLPSLWLHVNILRIIREMKFANQREPIE